MTINLRLLPCLAAIGLLAIPLDTATRADELGNAIREAVKRADESTVRLRVIGGEQSIDGDKVTSMVTTGVVISEKGEILASLFALQGNPEAILAEDAGGNRVNVAVIATDHVRRLVLLKAREGTWKAAAAASGDSVKVGQWSIAIGRFYSASSSNVSAGIVSALNRIHGMAIQTDAKISPVNYGGPLVNLKGEVMGILVPLSPRGQGNANAGIEWYDSGIGFAIPMNEALKTAERLRSGTDLKPGRLGMKLATTGMFSSTVLVDRVIPRGPAELAGLKKNDQIVAVNDRPIERVSILEEAVASSYAGDSIMLQVKRGEETLSMTVELAAELPVMKPGFLGFATVRKAKANSSDGKPDMAAIKRLIQGLPGEPTPSEPPPGPGDAAPKPKDESPDSDAAAEADAVELLVVNGSPAATAGLPVRVELLKFNDQKTTSMGELGVAIKEFPAGEVARIEYRIPGETETKVTELTASERLDRVIHLSDEFLNTVSVIGQPTETEPAPNAEVAPADVDPTAAKDVVIGNAQRKELSFDARGRCVVFSSATPGKILPGIVVLLSAQEDSEEQILQRWKSLLDSHKVIVAIPQNPEKSTLTAEDIPLVLTSIQGLAMGSKADLRRIVVVGSREQSRLAWQLMFGGPSPIRGICLTNGWIASSDLGGADGYDQSVLLLESPGNSQARALLTQSRDSLRKGGFWAPEAMGDSVEQTIADWSLLLRSF